MSPTSRRDAAERLAVLLEDRDADAAPADLPAEDQALASLAAALRTVPVPAPPMRAEARAELRAAVLDAARDQRAEAPLLTRMRDGARRLRYSTAAATGAGATAMALSGGGVALAAEAAGPGDALYGVKLALEDARLGLTFDEVARGDRAMSYAMDRIDEAREAAAGGDDAGAAEALRGAADRTRRGSELLLGTGLVDPVRGLAQDLADQVAAVEELRPALGPEADAAADELIAAIVVATEGVLQIIDADELPIGIPVLPALPVPERSTTPVPTTTATPTELPSAVATPTPTPAPTTGGSLPVPLPGLPTGPLEDAVDDVQDAVDDVLDGVGGATGGLGDGLGGTVEGLTDGLGDVIEETGGTVDGLGDGLEDTLDAVVDPVAPLLPAPLEDTVDQLPGTVDDVIDVVPGLLEPVDDVLDGLGGTLGTVLGGLR